MLFSGLTNYGPSLPKTKNDKFVESLNPRVKLRPSKTHC